LTAAGRSRPARARGCRSGRTGSHWVALVVALNAAAALRVLPGDTELGLIVKNMLDAIEWSRVSDLLRRPFGRFGSARS
jgi:hypothetical protein